MHGLMKFLFPLLLVSSICFAAPPAQLPQSGQTKCYDAAGGETPNCTGTGQDGEHRAGVAWDPETRFLSNDDGTVTDKLTGLIWGQDGAHTDPADQDELFAWQWALNYIKSLNSQNYKGHSDWRLPNLHELKSLLTYQEVPATWLSTRGVFANVRAANYWTSTTNPVKPNFAWTVNLGLNPDTSAIDDFSKQFGARVWPVRDGAGGVINLPRTGQTVCWSVDGPVVDCAGTGQDGEVERQKGVAWPSPRFKDMNDGTVRDNLTGLLWSKDAFPAATAEMDWQGALNVIDNLNATRHLGYDNWRIPNPLELASLVNLGSSDNTVWLESNGFTNVMAHYWTSTTNVAHSTSAWRVAISDSINGDAAIQSISKAEQFNTVWPVRTDNTPPETTATPAGETYTTPQTVTLSANEPATIYYTTNGTVPTTESATYSSSLTVGGSDMELKFFAVDELGNEEGIKTEPYVFTLTLDGVCGSADGGSFYTAPSVNLCSVGAASPVTGAGPWSWTCAGSGPGADPANCSASLKIDGDCGSADGGSFSSAPTANLCSAGTASAVSGSGPWDWTCSGIGTGAASDNCRALTLPTYQVSLASSTGGSLSGNTSQTVKHGSASTAVTAVPAAGYHFVNWTGSGGFTSTTNPLAVLNVTATMTIMAQFAADPVVINGGTEYALSRSVLVTLNPPAAEGMVRLSKDNIRWGKWLVLTQAPVKFALSGVDGNKTVYAQFKKTSDPLTGTYAVYSDSIILDTKAPVATIKVNNGDRYATSTRVAITTFLKLPDTPDSIDEICVSQSTLTPCSQFAPFTSPREYELLSGDGVKPVYVTLKDKSGRISKAFKASIKLDTVPPTPPPTGTSIAIRTSTTTPQTGIVLLLFKAIGASKMQISLDNGVTWGEWVPYAGNRKVTLLPGSGAQTVKVRFRDLAGNVSEEYAATVTL